MVWRFTHEEDVCIRRGCIKHANSLKKWLKILKDEEYTFHHEITADSIRLRAITLKLVQKPKLKCM